MPTIKDIMPESVFTIALSNGIQGRKGEPGLPGPIGPQGEVGPQGEPGKDYVLTKEDKEEITNVLDGIYKERIDIITPKNTSKGELVHITDGLPLPIYETKVDGNSKQDGEPTPTTPQPVEVVTGITNLFDGELELGNFNSTTGEKLTSTDYLINKNPIKVEELTKYKISLEGKGLRVYLFEYKEDMTYNLTTRKTINETSYISTEKGTKYINFRTIETNKNTNAKILLEKGTYINEYVPYGNNMNISNIGKNLLDISLIQRNGSYSYGNTGTVPTYTGGTSRAALSPEKAIIVKPNVSYTLTIPSGIRVAIAQLESDLKSLGDSGWQSSSTYTFTTKSNAKYVGFNFSKTDNTSFTDDDWNNFINSNLQFELGQATSYEPYQSNQSIINIGNEFLGKIGNVKDEFIIENNKVKLIKRIGKIVLNGSEANWGGSGKQFHHSNFASLFNVNINKQLISSHFKSSSTVWASNGKFGVAASGSLWITLSDDMSDMTLSEFKAWLSNNNVDVYYELATPEIIELGELTESIKTFEGVNNIQLLSNIPTEIEVKYAVDLKKYTDNKLAEISAQII